MAGAIDVRIVTLVGLVFLMGDIDRHPACLFFRSIVDIIDAPSLGQALVGQVQGDSRCQSGLAVIDVANSPDIDMRLVALKLFLSHS